MRRITPFLSHSIPWLLWTLSLLPILVWLYLSFFTRYLADDFSTTSIVLQKGLWQAQVYWYQSWTGKYLYNFLASLVELGGVRAVAWLCIFSMAAWIALLFSALRLFFQTLNLSSSNLWISMLANVIFFGTLKTFRDYSQVVYWLTGVIAYQVDIIIFLLTVIYFLKRFGPLNHRSLTIWEYALLFVAFLISGGPSETWAVMQIAVFTLGILAVLLAKKSSTHKELLIALLIGFLASCIALVVVAKAPGNMTRSSVTARLSFDLLYNAFSLSFQDVPRFLFEWFLDNTGLVAMLSLAGLFAGFRSKEMSGKGNFFHLRLGVFLLIGAYLLLWAGFFPGYTVFGIRPPERAIFTPMFIFLCAYVLLWFFAGQFLRLRYFLPDRRALFAQALLFISLALAMVGMQVRTGMALIQLIPSLQSYVRLWDERDAFLRQAAMQGQKDVVVKSIRRDPALHDLQPTIWILGELEEDPQNWKNRDAAAYYGLRSISGK